MDVMDGNCAITVCTLALDGRSVCAAAHNPLTVALLPGSAHVSRARLLTARARLEAAGIGRAALRAPWP